MALGQRKESLGSGEQEDRTFRERERDVGR